MASLEAKNGKKLKNLAGLTISFFLVSIFLADFFQKKEVKRQSVCSHLFLITTLHFHKGLFSHALQKCFLVSKKANDLGTCKPFEM